MTKAACKARTVLHRVDQLLIELHFPQTVTNTMGVGSGVRGVANLFSILEEAGLYPFSAVVNYNPLSGPPGPYPPKGNYPFAIE